MKLATISLLLISCLEAQAFYPSTHTKARVDTQLQQSARRDFFVSSLATAGAFLLHEDSARAAGGVVDYKQVSKDIAALIKKTPDQGPTMVRLAWHSSGTYDKMSKDGGSGSGTIRFKEELAHGGNAGLGATAVKWLEPIHAKYAKDGLSYADLYTLAGGK
jgi:catalase (peroxidase I)